MLRYVGKIKVKNKVAEESIHTRPKVLHIISYIVELAHKHKIES